MPQQDYFTYSQGAPLNERAESQSTRPPLPERKSARTMRDIISPWEQMPPTPPSCHTISFSRWSRFSASESSTPTGGLKASKLCANQGTSPSYRPPVDEWTYLGADQAFRCGKPEAQRSRHRRQQSTQQSSQQSQQSQQSHQSSATCPSLSSTASTTTSIGSQTEPMDFRRRDFKRAGTNSQLTESFKSSPAKGGQEQPYGMLGMMARLGIEKQDCEELPSAFDSDDEDEIDIEDLRPAKGKADGKGGIGRVQGARGTIGLPSKGASAIV